jgi:ornithine carbamoyltransferase
VKRIAQTLKGRDFTRIRGWTAHELTLVLDLAAEMKAARQRYESTAVLPRRTVAMIFQKPSTRTRVSFEAGIAELGGTALHLSGSDLQLGRGEPIRDTGYVLSRYLDGIMIRTFAQVDVEELAEHASVPVINGLTDEEHPCQALADLMTIRERAGGLLAGTRLVYTGDGNNVCVSLMHGAAALGMHFVAASPGDYTPPSEHVEAARAVADAAGGSVEITPAVREAAAGAAVLYTDVWTSMGQEVEEQARRHAFRGYAITPDLLALADPDAFVMHCLPAHTGEEIAADVLYGPRSAVWDQAENRLHAQKALMALIIP